MSEFTEVLASELVVGDVVIEVKLSDDPLFWYKVNQPIVSLVPTERGIGIFWPDGWESFYVKEYTVRIKPRTVAP